MACAPCAFAIISCKLPGTGTTRLPDNAAADITNASECPVSHTTTADGGRGCDDVGWRGMRGGGCAVLMHRNEDDN